jgi:hypothetical protein
LTVVVVVLSVVDVEEVSLVVAALVVDTLVATLLIV